MERRTFVGRTAAVLTAIGAAGCIGGSPSSRRTKTESKTPGDTSNGTTAPDTERKSVKTVTVAEDDPKTAVTTPDATTPTEPVRKTTKSVSATFTITADRGGGSSSEDTATARFEPEQNRIIVTGTIHVDGCGQLVFQSLRETEEGTIVLVVGPRGYGTPPGTVVCEHYTEEYKITLVVDGDLPETVKVIHRTENGDTFTLNSNAN